MQYKYSLNPQYKEFQDSLFNIESLFNTSDESIHKARNELKIIELEGKQCVIKAFKVPHIINKIAYTYFRDSKAKKSYINAMKLIDLKVSTPEPIGVIEFFETSLLSKSYFLSLYEPYDFTIREVFHHKVQNFQKILKEFAKFTYEIHQKGVWHIDYSLGNILVTQQKDGYKFSLVDINRMEFKTIEGYEGLKNFNKFWAKDDNDLVILATEYAKLASLDETKAIEITIKEAKALERTLNFKKSLKRKK